MSKKSTRTQVAARRASQLHSLKEEIGQLGARKPGRDIHRSFAVAARLATQAIEAAEDLQRATSANIGSLESTLLFWYRLRDYNYAAALMVAGGNQTLEDARRTAYWPHNSSSMAFPYVSSKTQRACRSAPYLPPG